MFGRNSAPPQSPQRIDSSGLVAPHSAAPPIHERFREPGGAPYGSPSAAPPPPPQSPAASAPPAAATAHAGRELLEPETADMSREVKLSRRYPAHDIEVDRLRFRRPTAQDLQTVNVNPFKFNLDDELVVRDVEVNWKAVAQYVSLLSVPPVPPSTVAKFDLDDLDECAGAISRFFMMRSAMRISLTPPIGSP